MKKTLLSLRDCMLRIRAGCVFSVIFLIGISVHAQPVWQSSITASGDGTSAAIGKPAGLAVGDLMVVGLMLEKGSGVTVTPPAVSPPWTLILSTNATTNFGMRSYWKIATAADVAAVTFSFGLSTSGKWTISNSRITGFNASAPIHEKSGLGSADNSSGVATAPSLTTTTANTLILAFFGIKKNVANNPALTAPLVQRHFHSANDVTNLLATMVQASAGMTMNKTASFSQAEWRVAQQIAIACACDDFILPEEPSEATEINCASAIDPPTPPEVSDGCGNEMMPTGPEISDIPECDGDVTYTWTYTDCDDNTYEWTYTFTVLDPVVDMPDDDGDEVDCPGDADAPDAPVIEDNCGRELSFLGMDTDDQTNGCSGTITYTYSYEDCRGDPYAWVYVFTVLDPVVDMPADDASQVACAILATQPTPPAVNDFCGNAITPTGPAVSGTYVDCEGTITYTWNYADCEGNNHDWVYTYTVEVEDFAANMPADDASQVACAILATQPTPPAVNDFCGNAITPTGPAVSGTYVDCEGTITYTWNYADCEGNNHDWVYTYTVEVEDFAANMPADDASQVACAILATQPTPPAVNDFCGNAITPTGPAVSGTYVDCEGTITYTWNYADCEGNNHDWVYTYTVEVEDFTANMPADDASQVACAILATQPTPPAVNDFCGNAITPTGPAVSGTYVDCEGTITYTWNYADCEGNNHDWVYTYTVEVEDFAANMPADDASQVACAILATQPTPPAVNDFCGNAITPTGPAVSGTYVDCEGTITYTWNYADCEGNNHDWVYTYTVEVEDFAANMPADDASQVACAILATQPTPPAVNDFCGNAITPTGPAVSGTYVDCEGTITYTWNYADCEGNNHDWVYTYTVEVEDFTANMPADDASQVACAILATQPTPPAVNDFCGNAITPTGPAVSGTYVDCEGTITYTWNYADCEGNNHDWVYTYTVEVEDFTANMPADDASQVACAILATQPTPPAVNDFCGNAITPTGPAVSGTYVDCEGTITYTWNYADCEGNNHDWVYTYTVEVEDFAANMPADDASQIACAILATQPTPPAVNDFCGNAITPTGPAVSGTYVDCEGTITYTWNYADCEGNNHDWVYTYTVEVEDFTANMPADDASQVACAILATQPTPPAVNDFCGNAITPTGPAVSGTYVDCEGTITYTWNYADCEGNNHDWVYTYTVEVEDFTANMPADDASQVACAILATQPTPPAVNDFCGNAITPTGPAVSGTYVDCEGTITYTWNYADCEGNNHDWVYTYTVEVEDFTVPADDGDIVACAAEIYNVTLPEVTDNCGNNLTPSGPVVSSIPECEGDVTYTWTYTDCANNSHDWTFTFTIVIDAPIRQSSMTAVGAGGTPAEVNKPAGTTAGDLLVVGLMIEKGSDVNITAPADWTLIRRTNQSTNMGMATYYKVAGASEPANYTWNLSNSPKWAIGISRITGAHTTSPIDVHGGASGGQVISAIAPSITTNACHELVLAFYSNKKNATWTPPAGTTERYDHPNNSEGQPSNMMASYVKDMAGATGTKTAVASEKENWVAQQVAIRSACMDDAPEMLLTEFPVEVNFEMASSQTIGKTQDEISFSDLKIYPNPANGEVFIHLGAKDFETVKITVLDMVGKMVNHKEFTTGTTISMDLSDHPAGMYLIRIDVDGTSMMKKCILDRK